MMLLPEKTSISKAKSNKSIANIQTINKCREQGTVAILKYKY